MLHTAGLLQGLSSILLLLTSKKKGKKANLATLKSVFFGESYIWEPEPAFPFLLSALALLIQYITLPFLPPIAQFFSASLFLPSFSYFNSNVVLFLFFFAVSLFISLSLISSLWGSFGSESRFSARLRQYFTLIKRMVGSTVGTAQEHSFPTSLPCLILLWWESVHIFHSIAPSSSEATGCGHTHTNIIDAVDLFVNLKMTSLWLHDYNEKDVDLDFKKTEVQNLLNWPSTVFIFTEVPSGLLPA